MLKQRRKRRDKDKVDVLISILLGLTIMVLIGIISFLFYWDMNVDKLPPDIKLKGDKQINLEVGSEYKELGYTAKFKKTDITKKIIVKDNIDEETLGDYEVKYIYNFRFLKLKKTVIRNVKVVDTVKPVLNIESEKELTVIGESGFENPKATATDNYDGDISKNIKVDSNVDTSKEGTYEVKYSVEDSSGNKTEDKIVVKVYKKNPKIYVSISSQRLYYYEYGKVVLSSAIVTGKNNATPRGHYKVLRKSRNVTLKGDDYESFVNYWIAFRGNSYGIHDASWRSSFGGSIYIYNGSHGCVNMPYYNVQRLYNLVSVGTPVIIE